MGTTTYSGNLETICNTTIPKVEKQVKKKKLLREIDQRMIVDGALILAGLTAGISGIIMPEGTGRMGGRNTEYVASAEETYVLPKEDIEAVHDVSGYLAVGLGTIHLAQHYKHITGYVKNRYEKLKQKKKEDA